MLIISLFVFNAESFAQCAGNDSPITICDKETYNQGIGNPNGVVNLFLLLGPSATSGGIWTNVNGAGGFNASTGILNTNQTLQGGVYNFRYTVNSVPGCTDNTATIQIILNGYAGFGTAGVLCTNFPPTNLRTNFNTTSYPSPDNNGVFTIAGTVISNIFNPSTVGPGNYLITYTTPSVDGCSTASTTNITIRVEQAPNAGNFTPLHFCETDDFSALTNVNLLNQLNGQDSGGNWIDVSATGEISDVNDTFINIQNIYNNFGPGTYIFRYTVNGLSPCEPANANLTLIIEPVVDINGSALSIAPSPICFNDLSTTTLTGTITQGVNPIPNGTYTITYALSGANSDSENVNITFAGGSGTFIINPSFVSTVGTTTVDITNIVNPNGTLNCTRTVTNLNSNFQIFENPNISDSQLEITDLCLGQAGQGIISDSNGSTIELLNGTYVLTFDLTGPNGTITNQTTTVSITNGFGAFSISSSLLSIDGNYTATITAIQNQASGCISPANLTSAFEVFPIPDAQTIAVTIQSICIGNDVTVNITGATNLPDGFYNLNYDITGAINTTNETVINVEFTGGIASFTLPTGILALGTSTLTITSLVSITNTCNTSTFNNPSDSFTISELPDVNNMSISMNAICIGSGANGTITAPFLTDGTYTIYYNLTGASTFTGSTSVTFSGGSGTITIPSTQLINNGNYTISITLVENPTTLCATSTNNVTDSFLVSEAPSLLASEVSVEDICLGSDAIVNIASAGGLATGNYEFTYTLFGSNGPSTQTEPFVISSSGNGSFTIASSVLTNTGVTSITIDTILNTDTNCSSTFTTIQIDFTVNELPDISNSSFTITIDDTCATQDASGTILNAINLSNGTYSFTYNLSGANTATDQVVISSIDTGVGVFIVPGALLTNSGVTTATITAITNTTTGCTTNGLTLSVSFEIIGLPDATGATVVATTICISESETITIQDATGLADGDYIVIYDLSDANSSTGNSETVSFVGGSGSFIIPSTLLVNGGTTTITIQSIIYNATQCGSSTLTIAPASFSVTDPGTPTLTSDGNLFCIQDNPTVASLTANISSTGTIKWYNSPTGGTPYDETDILTNGTTYYASLTTSGCEGSSRLEVTADLTNCSELFIPDGFSPNNDGLNDTFYIKDIAVLYPNFVLEIYNRYGNTVYSGTVNTPDFDGKANQSTALGKEILPTGVYFYILHYNDSTNKKPTQGRLYLSR